MLPSLPVPTMVALGHDRLVHKTTANYPAHADTVCGLKYAPVQVFECFEKRSDSELLPEHDECRQCFGVEA